VLRIVERLLSFLRRRALVLALGLAAWSVVAWAAAAALPVVSAPLERADAVVVLSGSSTYAERARLAARLLHEGRAPRIVLTNDATRGGYSSEHDGNPLFVERAAEELRRAGVAAELIEVVPGPVSSTHEECARLREYAASRGLRSVIVVTSAYHSRRARWTLGRAFDGSGVRVGLESVEPGVQTPRPATWWFSKLGWKLVPGEYLKLIYYRLRY
jgi:uncharacterized SAM-binding protein YcdF (DUF218 family)